MYLLSYEAWLISRTVDASKKIFIATRIIVFDFELFMGAGSQEKRADNFLELPAPEYIGCFAFSQVVQLLCQGCDLLRSIGPVINANVINQYSSVQGCTNEPTSWLDHCGITSPVIVTFENTASQVLSVLWLFCVKPMCTTRVHWDVPCRSARYRLPRGAITWMESREIARRIPFQLHPPRRSDTCLLCFEGTGTIRIGPSQKGHALSRRDTHKGVLRAAIESLTNHHTGLSPRVRV